MDTQIISVTSKGQIALPIKMRRKLTINAGDKLIAYTYDNSIILKPIKMPKLEELKGKLQEAENWAKQVGYTEEDINRIIKEIRSSK